MQTSGSAYARASYSGLWAVLVLVTWIDAHNAQTAGAEPVLLALVYRHDAACVGWVSGATLGMVIAAFLLCWLLAHALQGRIPVFGRMISAARVPRTRRMLDYASAFGASASLALVTFVYVLELPVSLAFAGTVVAGVSLGWMLAQWARLYCAADVELGLAQLLYAAALWKLAYLFAMTTPIRLTIPLLVALPFLAVSMMRAAQAAPLRGPSSKLSRNLLFIVVAGVGACASLLPTNLGDEISAVFRALLEVSILFVVLAAALLALRAARFLIDFQQTDGSELQEAPATLAELATIDARCEQIGRDRNLTERETEVLKAACKGRSYASIASELFVSANTVKAHMNHIYTKLDVHSKEELQRLVGL